MSVHDSEPTDGWYLINDELGEYAKIRWLNNIAYVCPRSMKMLPTITDISPYRGWHTPECICEVCADLKTTVITYVDGAHTDFVCGYQRGDAAVADDNSAM